MPTACETKPDRPADTDDRRVKAVFVVVWNDGRPTSDRLVYGVTTELSLDRMEVVLNEQFASDEDLLFGFWCDGPMLMRGSIERTGYLGAGFWRYAFRPSEAVPTTELEGVECVEEAVRYLNPQREVVFVNDGANRRQACRITTGQPVPALVYIKGDKTRASILNESADGFLVSVPASQPIESGQVVTVLAEAGCWECEVARLKTVGKEIHAGLRRLGEAPVPLSRGWVTATVILLIVMALATAYVILV